MDRRNPQRQRALNALTVVIAFAVILFTGLAVAEDQADDDTPSNELSAALNVDPNAPTPVAELLPTVTVPELEIKPTPAEEHASYLRAQLDRIRAEREKLEALQTDIREELAKLEKLRQEIDVRLAAEDVETLARVAKLVKIYDKMTGKQVTKVLEQQPEPLRIRLLFHMKEKRVSELLGEMTPEKAARISELLLKKTTK